MTHSGIELTELDQNVRPQDDLFRHVNGKWIERTEIPSDKAVYGSFAVLAENAEAAVRDIITGKTEVPDAVAGHEQQQIRGLYESFMDVERLQKLGTTPVEPILEKVDGVHTIAELTSLIGALERDGLAGFAALFVDNDPGNPDRYIVFALQAGIGLPDESYYREDQFTQVREAYRSHIARMFELLGEQDAQNQANLVYALEKRIARGHWNTVDSRDIQKLYNLKSFDELCELMPNFDWRAYLAALQVAESTFDEVVVGQPDALAAMSELYTQENLESWKAWLKWEIIRSSAALLTPEISRANFEFYGTTLTGAPEQRERWRRGVSFVEGAMGEAVGKLYVSLHFDETSKAEMDELVDHLIEAYRDSISTIDWMGEETKKRALEKLDKFTPKIGYPVKWRDYSMLEVGPDLMENARRVAEMENDREFGKVGKPLDRDEWFMTPQTVNAYYNPGMNEIVFPAAILQPPFFDKNADAAANFGAIGAVIGHEIGHGFDDQGSQYDGDGRLSNWWTEADREAFEQRTTALIDQYSVLSPEGADGHTVNGELTIGENIGDLGGLGIAWKAYQRFLSGAEPETIDGLRAGERFLLAWAQSWQIKSRPEEVVRRLTIDPHSPNEFRCNQIVRNLDLFHREYETTESDELWLAPDKRVTIW
jgi:putative endopeptidase